jgi:hypothetical protein
LHISQASFHSLQHEFVGVEMSLQIAHISKYDVHLRAARDISSSRLACFLQLHVDTEPLQVPFVRVLIETHPSNRHFPISAASVNVRSSESSAHSPHYPDIAACVGLTENVIHLPVEDSHIREEEPNALQ